MFPQIKGKVARQAHVGIPEGTYEEEHARRGFFGRTSHLYHLHPPTASRWVPSWLRDANWPILISWEAGFFNENNPL